MMFFTMHDKVFFYTYILFYAVAVEQHIVYGGTITAAATTVTVNFQSTLKLEWTAIPSPAEEIVVLKVFISPDINNGILTNTNPPVLLPTGMSLFGRNRLSATFINSKYTLMLKNVTYNDSDTFQMYAIFRKPAAYSVYQVKRSNIKVTVTGVPRVCGKGLPSKIIIAEKDALTITQDICGHPKPDCKWSFKGDQIWRTLLCSIILDDVTKQYRYGFKTRPLTRADCGKKIIFNASNELGSLAGETSVDVMFTPLTVSIKSLYMTSSNCIHATWTREDTGNCVVNYHLQINGKNDIYITSKSYLTICNLSRPAFGTIWASYKGLLGKKHSSTITVTIPKTTTTTTVIHPPACISYLRNCSSLSFCGKDLYKNITIMEKNMLTVSQDICGYPKPDVKWVWKGNVTLKHSSYYTALDGVTKQYRYEFKTQSLTRADCGKQIILIGKNQLGTIRRKSSVDVVFIPSMVLITTVYMHNSSCVYTTWRREDTGICTITYHLQFNNQDNIYSTLNNYLKICNLRNPTVVTIWASYKGRLGRKSSISITQPLMTTTTTRTATKRHIASDSNMHSVKAEPIFTSTSNVNVLYNTTLEWEWNMTLSAGEVIVGVHVYVLPDKTNGIITDTSPTVLPKGISIFGENRLSATFINSRYRLMLRNIRYNESLTFQLYVIYGAGDHLNSSRFNIQVTVKGTPKLCGVRLKSSYTVVENSTITFTQDICAHPKPVAEWKVHQKKLYKDSLNTSLTNTEQRKYRFTYKTRKLTRNDCGAKFILKATNAMGSVEETVKVDVIFKPSAVLIKSISRHNASCVKILWQREKMGNCILNYQLQFDGNSEIFFTSNTYFTMCTLLNITRISIWATHKGEIADITVGRIGLVTPTTEKKGIVADESKLTTKLIVILIVGSFVFTVILNVIFFGILLRKGFVTLNFKTKKQHQTGLNRHAEEYEVMGTTISNYTDINLHAIKPSVYTDLKTMTDDSNQYAEIEMNDVK